MDKRMATARANDFNLGNALASTDPNWLFVAVKGNSAGDNWAVLKYQRVETATSTYWKKVGIVA